MNKRFYLTISIILSLTLNGFSNWKTKVDSLESLITKNIPDSTLARIHFEIADEYSLNEPEKAYKHVLATIAIAERNTDSALLYKGYIEMGNYFLILNDYQSSFEYIYKAFKLSENNIPQTAYCHSRLSEVFFFSDEMDQSIYHVRKSFALNREIGDTIQMVYNLHDIGMWHLEFNANDSALYYLQLANSYHKAIDTKPNPLIICHLGRIYTFINRFDSALYYHFEALKIDSTSGSRYEVAIDEFYISHAYLKKKDYKNAVYFANKSLEHAKEIETLDIILYNYELLYQCYEEKGDYRNAFAYSLLRNDYADSLRDKNKESIIQGLNAKYSFDEQRQRLRSQASENTLLKKQKTLLLVLSIVSLLFLSSTLIIILQIYQKNKAHKRLLNELKRANDAKERMISVISHDLRSSVGTLRNAVLAINEKALDTETTNELISGFFPVVDSTYDLLENLLTWANYSKETLEPCFEEFDISSLIEKSIEHTHHLAESKDITVINTVKKTIVTADKNMLSTIVRNLISNSIKFSKTNSEVTITCITTNNTVKVSVIDEGIGIKPEILNQLFTSPTDYHTKGTRGECGSGLGLAMCKTFIEKQGGNISAQSELGKGSKFTFTVPVS